MANTQETEQCRARTADGDRCSRSAGEDGFCYQHGPEDETVDDAAGAGAAAGQAADEQGATATDGGTSAEQTDAEDGESEEDSEQADAEADEQSEQADAEDEREADGDEQSDAESGDGESEEGSDAGGGGDGSFSGVMDVRTRAESVTSDVVGAPLDRIIEIERQEDEDGWLVVVEALERSAIPDTEDLLGRYAIRFGGDGAVVGYRLRERYRRSTELDDTAEIGGT